MQKTVTYRQLVFILFITIITVSVVTISKTQAINAGRGAWIPVLCTGLLFGFIAILIIRLNKMFEGDTLFEYSTKIIGRFGAYALVLIYVLYFIIYSTYFCMTFFNLIKTDFLPKSPPWFLLLVSMPFLGLIAYKGITNIGRLAEIIGIIFLAVSVILSVTMFFEGRLNYILPLYIKSETGRYFGSIVNTIDEFTGIALLTLIPVSKADKKITKVVFFTLIGISLFYILDIYGCYMMIGLNEIKHANYPLIDAIRLVEYKKIEFLQRVDITYQTIGFIRVFVAKSIIYLAIVEYLCKVFPKAKRIKVVAFTGILLSGIDLFSLKIPDIEQKLFVIRTSASVIVSLIIPGTLLIMAKVKQNGQKSS